MQRVLTAAVGAPLALAALFLLSRVGFFAVILVLCLISAVELAKLGTGCGAGQAVGWLPVFVLVAALLLAEPAIAPRLGLDAAGRLLLLAVALVLATSLVALRSRGDLRERATSLWLLVFGTIYLSAPVFAIDQLRSRDPWWVVFLLAVLWLTDTGAFLIGGRWGRRKLAPRISPNKTWEGAIGGLLLGVAAAGVWSWWRLEAVAPSLLLTGALISTAGQIGDGVESLFKRAAGVKDSGTLLPGHGGMLDRLDSLFLAAPVLELVVRLALD